MLYKLEQGPTEKLIREQSDRYGMPLPEKIANAPTLEFGLEFYFEAFRELVTCRGYSGSIPFTAINEYCEIFEIFGIHREDLFFHIRGMEVVLTTFSEQQRKRNQ